MELERICSQPRLRQGVSQSWAKQWAPRILNQAVREKSSNSRLRKVMGEERNCGMLFVPCVCMICNAYTTVTIIPKILL